MLSLYICVCVCLSRFLCVSVGLSMDVVRALVPMLVMGSKEKNAAVKSYSEQAQSYTTPNTSPSAVPVYMCVCLFV